MTRANKPCRSDVVLPKRIPNGVKQAFCGVLFSCTGIVISGVALTGENPGIVYAGLGVSVVGLYVTVDSLKHL